MIIYITLVHMNFEVTHWNFCSAFNPSKCTHTVVNTHPEQWAANAAAPKVQGSRFFIIRHIHNHTSIISSEMQVELKKNTAFT